jgi:hypothetical protein
LADILDELLDRVTDLKDANLNGYPDISQIRLSNIEWNNSSDKIKVTTDTVCIRLGIIIKLDRIYQIWRLLGSLLTF